MSKRSKLLVAVMSLILFTACGPASKAPDLTQPINIIATTGIVGDLVQELGGDAVKVTSLMGPGVDPHLYKASEGDVTRLAEAEIIFYHGMHLEAKMADVLEKLQASRTVVSVADSLPDDQLLGSEDAEGQHDPHVWFDVQLWKKAADPVTEALKAARPDRADYLDARKTRWQTQMDDLETSVRACLEPVPEGRRVLITAHDAFRYFGRAYNIEVRGLQGISTAGEASARDVDELAQFIVDRQIPAIFVESSVPRRNVEAVLQAVHSKGGNTTVGGELLSDALGDAGTPQATYFGTVLHNACTVGEALSGGAQE